MKRTASAVWQGNLKDGKGTVSTESGVLSQTPYSFSTRFENARGTNPEELIAAAHAGCFSMALAAELGKSGVTADSIRTTASLTMERLDAGWTVCCGCEHGEGRMPYLASAQHQDYDGRPNGGRITARSETARLRPDA